MELHQIVIRLIPVVVMALVFAYLRKTSSRELKTDPQSSIKLRMSRFYQIIGFVGIIIAILFIYVPFNEPDLEMIVLSIPMVIMFGFLGTLCLAYYYNHSLVFDEHTVKVCSWSGAIRELDWKTIDKIKFNSYSGNLVLKGNNRKIKINHHLVGFKTFINAIEKNTRWNAEQLKLPI